MSVGEVFEVAMVLILPDTDLKVIAGNRLDELIENHQTLESATVLHVRLEDNRGCEKTAEELQSISHLHSRVALDLSFASAARSMIGQY